MFINMLTACRIMTETISDLLSKADIHLDLRPPFLIDDICRAFRKKASHSHPDIDKNKSEQYYLIAKTRDDLLKHYEKYSIHDRSASVNIL
jgi:hypothetical protein